MKDPILASRFNRLQLFLCETLLYQFCRKLGFEIWILKPSRPSTYSPFNHSTSQCRARTGQVANFAKRDKSILVYTPYYCHAHIEFNRLYTVYLFEGTFSKFMKQKLMLCLSLDNFKTNQSFWSKIISCQCVIKRLSKFLGFSYRDI